jgi:protein SCO1
MKLTLWTLALLLSSALQAAPALKAGVFDPPHAAPAFRLDGSDGQPMELARWRGKLVMLVFGFTNCPEVCPTTLLTLAQARQQLGAAAADVQVLYVTVDPERDSLPKIKSYLAAFDKSFVGGTAKPAELEAMRKRYGVMAAKLVKPGQDAGKDLGNYGMNHSTSVFLIDRQGSLRAMMPFGHGAADFAHDLRLMLAGR